MVTLLVGSFLFLLCASGVDEGVFRTSPFHSLVDDLGELRSGFPELVALQEVVARGVDYISTTGETALMPSLQTRVLGRGFHRTLQFEIEDVLHTGTVDVLIFQRLGADVYADPYELESFQVGHVRSVEMRVVGPLDLESPASSSFPTLLFLRARMAPEQTGLNLTVPLHAKYPEAISREQSRACNGGTVDWMPWSSCYVCVELDHPIAVLDVMNGLKMGIVLVSQSRQRLTIPAGNADHTVIVALVSLLVLLASSIVVLWMLFTTPYGQPVLDQKTQ